MKDHTSVYPPLHPGDETLPRYPMPQPQPGLGDLPHPANLIAGALVGLYALKRRGLVGLFSAGISAGLFYRGAQQNDLLSGGWLRRALHTRAHHLVPFERRLIIDRPVADVYRFWRNLENLAIFLPNVHDVRALGAGRTHWQLRLSESLQVDWTAEIVHEEPQQLLVWRTDETSDLFHQGWIEFSPRRDGQSTSVHLRLYLLAPGGTLGARVLERLRELPVRYFSEDLQRFRTILESSTYEPEQRIESTETDSP